MMIPYGFTAALTDRNIAFRATISGQLRFRKNREDDRKSCQSGRHANIHPCGADIIRIRSEGGDEALIEERHKAVNSIMHCDFVGDVIVNGDSMMLEIKVGNIMKEQNVYI